MSKKYDDLKMRKILFTYKEYDFDDVDMLILLDGMSGKDKMELELDIHDEKERIESDMIGIGNYNFDEDDCIVGEDAAFLELQEYKSNHGGVILRFYSSEDDFENDDYFGKVIIDTKFTLEAKFKNDKKVIRDILREYGIGSFGNNALEEKREILLNVPADEVIDNRSGYVACDEVKVICKKKD